jgi:hypothetical protein
MTNYWGIYILISIFVIGTPFCLYEVRLLIPSILRVAHSPIPSAYNVSQSLLVNNGTVLTLFFSYRLSALLFEKVRLLSGRSLSELFLFLCALHLGPLLEFLIGYTDRRLRYLRRSPSPE